MVNRSSSNVHGHVPLLNRSNAHGHVPLLNRSNAPLLNHIPLLKCSQSFKLNRSISHCSIAQYLSAQSLKCSTAHGHVHCSVAQMLKLTFKMSLLPKMEHTFDFHNFIVYLNLILKCIAGVKPSKFKVGIVWT